MNRSKTWEPVVRQVGHAWGICLVAIWPTYLVCLSSVALPDFPSVTDRLVIGALSLTFTGLFFAVLPWRLALLALWPWFALAPLDALHISLYGTSTSLGVLAAVVDTNPAEAREFLVGSVSWGVGALVSLVVWPLLLLSRFRPRARLAWKSRAILVASFLLVLFVHWERQVRRHGNPLQQWLQTEWVADQIWPAGGMGKLGSIVREKFRAAAYRRRVAHDSWQASVQDTSRSTWVLVIGESSRADRWSLCGAQRETNPRLSADSGLVAFCDVASPSNITNAALSLWLTPSTPERPEDFYRRAPVIDAFREAGYRTWWLSSQGRFGRYDSRVSLVASRAERQQYLAIDQDDPRSNHDEALLPLLEAALADTARRKLVVVHTMGSHLRYDCRYPKAFDRFQPSLQSTRGWDHNDPAWAPVYKNSYDNTILYTDWFLDQVVARLRVGGGSGMVYFSDHGEQLWEDRSCPLGHGSPDPVLPEVRVPMLLWTSARWQEAHREQWTIAKERAPATKVGAKDLVPTLLDLVGIRSPAADTTRSLVRPGYREHRRLLRTPEERLLDADTLPAAR